MNERLNAANGCFVVDAGVRGLEVWVRAARSAIRSPDD